MAQSLRDQIPALALFPHHINKRTAPRLIDKSLQIRNGTVKQGPEHIAFSIVPVFLAQQADVETIIPHRLGRLQVKTMPFKKVPQGIG